MKQPHEIKADYKKANHIIEKADILTKGKPYYKKDKLVRKAICFDEELELIKRKR